MPAPSISSCVPVNSTARPMQPETQNPSPTPVSPISTSTFTPAETTTPTLLATLDPDQTKDVIKTLLQEPIDCASPCFWGIVPEQTIVVKKNNLKNYVGVQPVKCLV